MIEQFQKQLDRIEKLALLAAKNVLTLEDAAILLNMSKSHLYKLTSAHEIPHYKPNGKLVYFDRAELEEWQKRGRISTTEEVEDAATAYRCKKGGIR